MMRNILMNKIRINPKLGISGAKPLTILLGDDKDL